MVYARLYPTTLVESYRQAMRGIYTDVHGADAVRTPTVGEWAAFSANRSMRDMGAHLCARPTGEHCPKGLVCLGCNHAQPKKSAAPTFRRMLASHTRVLTRAQEIGESAGQIAARQLEIERIRSALQRAEELSSDVAPPSRQPPADNSSAGRRAGRPVATTGTGARCPPGSLSGWSRRPTWPPTRSAAHPCRTEPARTHRPPLAPGQTAAAGDAQVEATT
jgi:hypothetical protein